MAEGRLGTMPKKIIRYFRDVNDHLIRTVEQVVSYDDLLNSILQARLAQVTVDQNNDMRKIASWAAIAAMQTAIAGVYGMNFPNMPEFGWQLRLSDHHARHVRRRPRSVSAVPTVRLALASVPRGTSISRCGANLPGSGAVDNVVRLGLGRVGH